MMNILLAAHKARLCHKTNKNFFLRPIVSNRNCDNTPQLHIVLKIRKLIASFFQIIYIINRIRNSRCFQTTTQFHLNTAKHQLIFVLGKQLIANLQLDDRIGECSIFFSKIRIPFFHALTYPLLSQNLRP